jgi:hypothetical protein
MAQPAYEYPSSPAPPPAPVPKVRSWTLPLIARMGLTLLGAAGIIVGAFLEWVNGIRGVKLDVQALYRSTFEGNSSNFVATVGFVVIVIGLLAILGLAPRSGLLTRFAGALGIVAFMLFEIQVFRATGDQTMGAGVWVSLGGSVIALMAGFIGARSAVTATPSAPTLVE